MSWSYYRDADHAHRFIESFVLTSWDEHMRQHQRRTVTDAELQAALHEYLREGTAVESWHYVQPPEPSLLPWRR